MLKIHFLPLFSKALAWGDCPQYHHWWTIWIITSTRISSERTHTILTITFYRQIIIWQISANSEWGCNWDNCSSHHMTRMECNLKWQQTKRRKSELWVTRVGLGLLVCLRLQLYLLRWARTIQVYKQIMDSRPRMDLRQQENQGNRRKIQLWRATRAVIIILQIRTTLIQCN